MEKYNYQKSVINEVEDRRTMKMTKNKFSLTDADVNQFGKIKVGGSQIIFFVTLSFTIL